ncbi:hypothetical protein PMAYCL1PPCAC_20691, partial [Pristionchus mayeri]
RIVVEQIHSEMIINPKISGEETEVVPTTSAKEEQSTPSTPSGETIEEERNEVSTSQEESTTVSTTDRTFGGIKSPAEIAEELRRKYEEKSMEGSRGLNNISQAEVKYI